MSAIFEAPKYYSFQVDIHNQNPEMIKPKLIESSALQKLDIFSKNEEEFKVKWEGTTLHLTVSYQAPTRHSPQIYIFEATANNPSSYTIFIDHTAKTKIFGPIIQHPLAISLEQFAKEGIKFSILESKITSYATLLGEVNFKEK